MLPWQRIAPNQVLVWLQGHFFLHGFLLTGEQMDLISDGMLIGSLLTLGDPSSIGLLKYRVAKRECI